MFEVTPGKEKSLLSTVRAMDCSLTTSMDCPMCTVDGMLLRVPRTNSATSCTVNICSSSSKMAGNEFNRAAWGRRGREEAWGAEVRTKKERKSGLMVLTSVFVVERHVTSFCKESTGELQWTQWKAEVQHADQTGSITQCTPGYDWHYPLNNLY